ncbi:IMP cyclohydrolase [Candidatus Bathyarchaeota archaeon]|nr:IMP cyclohydrolase [Candidatus Bathyarchaeota archaeon]
MKLVKRALISVYDKTGLEKLLKTLAKFNVEIISSGGTFKKIKELGYEALEVSDYTGYPEMPGGLVKTLHPKIHGGILGDLSNPNQREYMEKYEIKPIDLIVVNLYPFGKYALKEDASLKEIAENIDIGGPAMIRAAAKASLLNERVAVIVDSSQYDLIIKELEENNGEISLSLKRKLAVEAFIKTWKYDEAIKNYLLKKFGENNGEKRC